MAVFFIGMKVYLLHQPVTATTWREVMRHEEKR